ncbi:DUF6907 domain-containing protein [Allonocardiopsis opalescens]|uniref:Uncharacterized protein n=1 Tax=Allonocardiopsis opalescens TaxID=1144618 RepID=A0A2T0PPM5_9ACTN|nr:hypothetical protein [Allonocardiopsis opalescens]PRX90851.1 hypothetical protein CLV72_11647 [Allonocardiopsis opalescens]
MSAPDVQADERPYWQTRPCPTWCSSGHARDESIADALHMSHDFFEIVATTEPPICDTYAGERYVEAQAFDVSLSQYELEREPRVWLGLNQTSTGLKLTLGEASALADALRKLVDAAEATS